MQAQCIHTTDSGSGHCPLVVQQAWSTYTRGVVLTLEWDLRVKGGCWPRKSGVSTAGVGMASGVLAWC